MHVRGTEGNATARAAVGVVVALAATAALSLQVAPVAADARSQPRLTLVALAGPGTSADAAGSKAEARSTRLRAQQDEVLASVGARSPTYRWTTALNGFALPLTEAQVDTLESDPRVALVEPNRVLPLASRARAGLPVRAVTQPGTRGGAGVVVGIVDSGISPASPVFAAVPGLGPDPVSFRGACATGEDWGPDVCNRKLVGARWYVEGFGSDRLNASETLSATDDLGHGTQVASVAAGNAGVSVRVAGRDAGVFGGLAPQARIAAYKACWAAPDPDHDGCATADLVAAVDAAVGDRVDVLNLAVGSTGSSDGIDIVDLALLGAAEADIVVVGAAGNAARSAYAAHPAPWVTTIGAATGGAPRATLALPDGTRLVGGGRPGRVEGRLVDAADARAGAASAAEARQCRAGTLDAAVVADAIVVCERGGIGRIDKSAAVAQADGAAMVLVNTRPGSVSADFHSIATVHLNAREARVLARRMARNPRLRAALFPEPGPASARRVAPWSPEGDPRGPVVKPDAIAAGESALGAVPAASGASWATFSGSSAASARATGLAAVLRGRTDWSAPVIRSMLTTTARPLPGTSVLAQGAGVIGNDVPDSNLALDVRPGRWRRSLEAGDVSKVNSSSVVLRPGVRRVVRRVTNVGARAEYFSVSTTGFKAHRVSVRPLAVRLAPGESARFAITAKGPERRRRMDDGFVVWRGARGGTTRVPVALTR